MRTLKSPFENNSPLETAILSILLTFSIILMILEVAQQKANYVSFLQSNIFEVLMKIVSIRAILFKFFENRKLPLETGTPWGALLKCRMIASNQHSNVFWTFIFIRSFFMIPSPHIVCLRRNQAGKIVKIMQQAKRQQYFDEFFVEDATGQGKHFGTVGIFPHLPCESEEGSVHLLFRIVPAWFKNVPQGLGNNDLTSFLLL